MGTDKIVDLNIKNGDVIEVAPRARVPHPESHEDEVKQILYNTSQFIENVLSAYNEILDSDAKAKSKEKIHKEIKRFTKLRKQASPSHVQRERISWLFDECSDESEAFQEECQQFKKSTE